MACQVFRDGKGNVINVKASNGQNSILFKDLSSILHVDRNDAARLWAHIHTDFFKERYFGEFDKNNEPILRDSRDLLGSLYDETLYMPDKLSRLQTIAARYQMSEDGYFPRHIDKDTIKKELSLANINATIESSDNGNYLRLRGKYFNPLNPTFDLDRSDLPPDVELDRTINVFLHKVGAKVNTSDYTGQSKNDMHHRVNVFSGIIDIVEGRRNKSTLTEEAAHIMVAMMRHTDDYTIMMGAIDNFLEYQQVVDEYGSEQEYDDNKLREEAIVKKITNEAINEFENTRNETWLDYIIRKLKELFKPEYVSEFTQAARRLLDSNISGLRKVEDTGSNVFFQKIKPNKQKQKYILDKLKEQDELGIKTIGDRYFIEALNKWVRFRPTDKVSKYSRHVYSHREFTPELKDIYTTKGTIIHFYNQLIMEHLKDGVDYTHAGIESMVYNALKDHPEFKGKKEDYFKLTVPQFNSLKYGVTDIYEGIMEKDPGAVILTEKKIYDPVEGYNDIAGTLDLLIVYSDGNM